MEFFKMYVILSDTDHSSSSLGVSHFFYPLFSSQLSSYSDPFAVLFFFAPNSSYETNKWDGIFPVLEVHFCQKKKYK